MKLKFILVALIAAFCFASTPSVSIAQTVQGKSVKAEKAAPLPAQDIKLAPAMDITPATAPVVAEKETVSLEAFLQKSSTVAYALYPAISFLFVMFWKRKDPQERVENIIKATTIVLGIGLTLIVSGLPALNVLLIGSILIWAVALYKGLGKQAAKPIA